jgi:hypothetical protein
MYKVLKLFLLLLITTLLLGIFIVPTQAATSSSSNWDSCITVPVLIITSGDVNVIFEKKLGDSLSMYGGGYILSGQGTLMLLGGGANYYFQGQALDGFYGGGGLILMTIQTESSFGFNLHGGYKMILDKGLTIDAGLTYSALFNSKAGGDVGVVAAIGYAVK